MPSLTDKLRSLGVNLGARDLPAARPTPSTPLDEALGGQAMHTPMGETYRVERRYVRGGPYGSHKLEINASLLGLARWAGLPRIGDLPVEAFAFIDTETTGLSGGAGVYAFLIGAGRFSGDDFLLAQFFLRDPAEEAAQLAAFEEFLAPCQAIISFNGKAFDAPLLYNRFVTHGWRAPLLDLMHIDLLHLARRLWRDRLPSRTLMNLEWQILGALRTEEDVPGWMIPSLYFDYLRFGEIEPLRKVLYHNAMDVVSLAVLMDHMAGLLEDPLQRGGEYSVDLIALGRLFEDLGDLDTAARLYFHGLEHEDALAERIPRQTLLDAIQRLAGIRKRQQDLAAASALWEQAANHQHLEAHLELAKYYEHQQRDYAVAIHWTQTAILLVEQPAGSQDQLSDLNLLQRRQWLDELHHRMERLQRKLMKITIEDEPRNS